MPLQHSSVVDGAHGFSLQHCMEWLLVCHVLKQSSGFARTIASTNSSGMYFVRYTHYLGYADSHSLSNQSLVPQDAVLNTGTEQYVFLDLGQGYVEPRLVEVGPPAGDNYAILKGLKPGERVVTGANFIVDAESRLKGAFANMGKGVPLNTGQPATRSRS